MTAETVDLAPLEVLRRPFDPKVVGKLPRVTCGACSKKSCQQHKPAKCQVCGAWITTAHMHLDYVGHAEVTDRLLSADPAWNWEPLAWTEEGFPKFTKGAGGEMELWIRLTVCGVTRLGVGSVAGNAFDAEKQLIGDALRNAAMRFGVALDLWAKEELESQLPSDEEPKKVRGGAGQSSGQAAAPPSTAAPKGVDEETGEVKTRRRKPPTASPADPESEGRPASSRKAPDEKVAEVERLINVLKEAGGAWADIGRARWKAAGVPAEGANRLMEADADLAIEVLTKVAADIEQASAA